MLFVVIISFAVLVGVGLAIYAMPPEAKSKKKEKRPEPAAPVKPKDKEWESIAHRWEKQNLSLQAEINSMKMAQKDLHEEISAEKAKAKEFVEKLTLEQGWRQKEQANQDKLKTHERDLKEQVGRTESDLEKEHATRLRAERDHQEVKVKYDALVEEKRQLSTKAMSMETTVTALSKEIRDLKRVNDELGRKREDIQWVAKSEFEEIKKLLLAKEQEIVRLRNLMGP